ncbi:helix-turn-helix transcriptional regulator [Planctomonas sp. JC2975]|uniref:LuxR C-terminal-related transcriptional regulator n=1 Tax=Planctomonas sp. JC2975 TaxID=2729626 RepID=UPI0014748481|nr:helix-turn-helix transcriptional regulator [Planctomonas sp. JC2975]
MTGTTSTATVARPRAVARAKATRPTAPAHAGAAPGLWPRLARLHIDNLLASTTAPRSLVVGPAGSGKTSALHYLHDELRKAGRATDFAHDADGIRAMPPAAILLVDDAHLLDQDALLALADRVADPTSATLVACRPWPTPEGLAGILSTLDTPGLAIVLGQVSTGEVAEYAGEGAIAGECIDDLVELCAGMTWLLSEALSLHDQSGCSTGPAHDAVVAALNEVVAQRLHQLDPDVRLAVETESLTPSLSSHSASQRTDLVVAAHAQGLLLRNGQVAPGIRSAVRAATPIARIVSLADAGLIEPSAELLHGVRDHDVARTMLHLGDAALESSPERAAELYDHAANSGADPVVVAVRRARALWASGLYDEAAAAVDGLDLDADDPDAAFTTNLVAAVWAARAMPETADRVYRSSNVDSPVVRAGAVVASLAVGDPREAEAPPIEAASSIPSTAVVAMESLSRGLRATLGASVQIALSELMRASDAYTMSGDALPVPELPAVLAAVTALHLGELEVAAEILDDATRDGQGGPGGRGRLALWTGWVALQRQRPHDVEAALATACTAGVRLSPRDQLLEHALRIGLARRYSDTAAITIAWRRARETMLRSEFDLYGILPLSEFVVTAARLDDLPRMRRHFDQALGRIERLGNPSMWGAHLHWAGIQQGILLNQPEMLRPHAQALVAAGSESVIAAAMSHAGRVWTSVLAGKVDAAAVEAAASELADVGLAWDGARLAGYGAGLTEDRRVVSRLLACARRLHSNETIPSGGDRSETLVTPIAPVETTLSVREREVAAMVLDGKTYAEIGAAIFISPRTAEHHIARIRRRLGATSRSDLLTKLRLALESPGEDAHA